MTRPPKPGEIRNLVEAVIIRFFLAPGSHPPPDLAGMTNWDRIFVREEEICSYPSELSEQTFLNIQGKPGYSMNCSRETAKLGTRLS